MAIRMHMPPLTSVRGQTLLTDNKPYLYRQSPIESQMLEDMIVGGTVAWNQLVNGAGTVTVTNNHKYVSHIGSTWSIAISNGSAISVGASDLVTDLTLMFSPTIADYVYSLEQSTAGSGIAWLKSFGFFTEDYYPYDSGSLLSVKTSGHKTVGKNLFEPLQAENAIKYNGSGLVVTDVTSGIAVRGQASGSSHAAGFIIGNADDYIGQTVTLSIDMAGENATPQVNFITCDETFGSRSVLGYRNASGAITATIPPTATGKKLGVALFSTTGTDSESAVSTYTKMQLEYGSTATPYEPYTAHTYPLSDIELRGIPKLTDGQLYYDGDTYESSGTVTRKYGIRAYQAGDESLADAVTDGTNTVYKLVAPTTETTDSFTNPQTAGSTEEYIDERTVPMPVGHVTEYFNMVQKESISMHMPTVQPIKMHMPKV